MLGGGIVVALLIGILVFLVTASILWAVVAFILVLLLTGGVGYSRRW